MPLPGLKSPLTFIVLLAALWTFLIAQQRPAWIRQGWRRRLLITGIEGMLCGGVWACILAVTEGQPTALVVVNGSVVLNGLVSGLAWTLTAFYSRTRALNILRRASGQRDTTI